MLSGKKKKIIFIGHEASLSGAPILLLNLLLLLKKETELKISVVIRREGSFIKSYEEHFPVLILKRLNYGKEKNIIQKTNNRVRNRLQIIRVFIMALSADVIFSNTIINGKLLKQLFPFKNKIITYVHELQNVIESYLSSGDSAFSLKYSALFAYPSVEVKEMLEIQYKINGHKLHRLSYYFPVDLTIINNEFAKIQFRKSFAQKFDINIQFLVGCAGVMCKRKGTDLFIEVCHRVLQLNRNIRFCWIGQYENFQTQKELQQLIKDKGVSENILLTGPLPHHQYNFSVFDLFFLSSREDPYPLVVLEAAFMKVPSICFNGSGGITEFIDVDAGWTIPGFSIDHAVEKILYLYNNRNEIINKGKCAFNKALTRHSNKQLVLEQFNELINRI